jgi:hypothetical protein
MGLFLVCVVLLGLIAGGVIAFGLRRYDARDSFNRPLRVRRSEYVLGVIAVTVVAFIVTLWAGPGLAQQSAIGGYKQFYNGSVTQVYSVVDTCRRDGSCAHHYQCDPYQEKVVTQVAFTDSNNVYHSEVSHYETRYHSCPYATKEIDYVIADSIGRTIAVGRNYFEANPKAWRGSRSVPSDVPRDPPERWVLAKQNLEAGKSDPVTAVREYANYVLSADGELYKQYDGSVEQYQKAGLLPKHTLNLGRDVLYDHGTQAAKLQAVAGAKLNDPQKWQDRLMRFNAALGSDLQGDMHVLVVPAIKVSDPDNYVSAVKAYWTRLGKWSIAKNGIILVIGVNDDASVVEWSRAATGMPGGNGEMIAALNMQLGKLDFTPENLFGEVKAAVRKDGKKFKVAYDYGSGVIAKIVFSDFSFKRACMVCEDKDDAGVSYVGLKDLVPVSTGAKILMFFVTMLLSGLVWAAMAVFDPFSMIVTRSKPSDPFVR